jgi:hypothetical protein
MSINLPSNPNFGDQYTASNDVTYVWDNVKWISIGSTKGSGGVSIGEIAPENPSSGDLWFNTISGLLYIYLGSESVWVDSRPGPDGLVGLDGSYFTS